MHKMLTLTAFCLLLMSCGTMSQAPDPTYYLFDAEPRVQELKNTTSIIKLEQIKLADYLSTHQLVMRDGGQVLIKANYHSWADSLEDAIGRVLLSDLNNLNENTEFVTQCNSCDSISVTIEHFYPGADGKLLLSGFFKISSKNAKNSRSHFQLVDDLSIDGYANAVKQMREQVDALAVQINQKL